MERSDLPTEAPIATKTGLFERLVGWCIEGIVKLVWRVLVKPVLVAAFSPLLMVVGLAKMHRSTGAIRRSDAGVAGEEVANEAKNPTDDTDGPNAVDKSRGTEEGRKNHG